MTSLTRLKLGILGFTACFTAQLSAAIDPYAGLWQFSQGEMHFYILIKKQGGQYYSFDHLGKHQLVIKPDHSFTIENNGEIIVTGHFERPEGGVYQAINSQVNNQQLPLTRSAVAPEQHVTHLIQAMPGTLPLTNKHHSNCAAPYQKSAQSLPEVVTSRLQDLKDNAHAKQMGLTQLDSLLIWQDGALVVEEYYNGWSQQLPHQVNSVTKSVISLLADSAVTEGAKLNYQAPISQYLPQYQNQLAQGKEQITLQQTLTMSSGLEWDEWSTPYHHRLNPQNIIANKSGDSVRFTLSTPFRKSQNNTFNYSAGDVTLTAEAIANATNTDNIADYATQSALAKLCFENAYWQLQHDGRPNAGGGLNLRPRDMLKIGELVLQQGQWHQQRLIKPDLIQAATTAKLPTPLDGPLANYGHYWWTGSEYMAGKTVTSITADGYGGQQIVIYPELDLILVMTASAYNSDFHNLPRKVKMLFLSEIAKQQLAKHASEEAEGKVQAAL
ncbi:serine hydrolase domain-containing protein [Motilimonas pumila]|nr:serine hydrolase [Motilimonas pumila]